MVFDVLGSSSVSGKMQLCSPITAAHTLAGNDNTSTRWPRLYQGRFGLILYWGGRRGASSILTYSHWKLLIFSLNFVLIRSKTFPLRGQVDTNDASQ